jgi:hypothetical protein
MIIKENTHLLFIEPKNKELSEPIFDELTMKLSNALDNATQNGIFYKGVHFCVCGAKSANFDLILPNGQITNSLAMHYMSHHRDEVPEYELKKVRKL